MAIVRVVTHAPQTSMEATSTAGTFSYVTSPALGAGASLRTNPTTTNVGNGLYGKFGTTGLVNAAIDIATAYYEFPFQIATAPSADDEPIFQVADSGVAQKFELRLNSDRKLVSYNAAGTLLATGATVLALNTRYWIGIRVGTGATSVYEVQIDGVQELTDTVANGTNNNAFFRLGKWVDRNGETVDFYYGHCVVNDSAFYGDVLEIAAAIPTGDGSTMAWVNGSGGAGTGNYEEVDEVPISDADYVESTAQNDVALFDMQDSATIGASGTIHAVVALMRVKRAGGANASTVSRIRSGSTNSDTSSQATTSAFASRGMLALVDPDTTAAWTTSGIDGIEIGQMDNHASERSQLSCALVAVLYEEAAGGASVKDIIGMGFIPFAR